ncbi:hypothetical protein LTR53_005912 [Teratosphaeriaceae sp. CCFEE 6253]|nr:hypothetical protein LTR53_005912 [Teratosphaeriaceae sp. CCFEE 6253]
MHRTFALLALAAGSAVAAPFNAVKARQAVSGLNSAIIAAGKLYFGTATENPSDAGYQKQLTNTADFGQLTPANSMKWDTIEASRGSFNFAGGDAIADLAAKNGQKLRCHTLVWYSQLPSWVSSGGFDNATLIEVMTDHITAEVTHYKGQCYAWDVVNEAISDNGDGSWRNSVFYETIGEAFIPIAFAAAAAADPDAKLYYNDYNVESDSPKATAALNIVKLIQSYGVKIDGIGMQSHFIVGETPSKAAQVANMEAFEALGVEVAITELDICTDTPVTSAAQTQQATDYASTMGACMAVEACIGVTLWDWTDKYSWIPGVFPGTGSALPWNENLEVKTDVYAAILSAIGGAAIGTTSSAAVSSTATIVSSSSSLSTAVQAVTSSSSAAASTTSSYDAAPVTKVSSTTSTPSSTAFSTPAAPSSSSVTVNATAPYPTSFTTFATLCTETANGTTYTTLHTHSAPVFTGTGIVGPSANGTSVAPVMTGILPTATREPKCVVEYEYVYV